MLTCLVISTLLTTLEQEAPNSGISYVELDVSTGATTATLPLKATDISGDPENSDVSTANTNVLVTLQNHLFGQKQVGLA